MDDLQVDTLQELVAQCEDPQSSILLRVDPHWLTTPALERALRWKGYSVARVQTEVENNQAFFAALTKAGKFPTAFGFDQHNRTIQNAWYSSWKPTDGIFVLFEAPVTFSDRTHTYFLHNIKDNLQASANRSDLLFKVLIPDSAPQIAVYDAPQRHKDVEYIRKVVAYCQDPAQPVLLELDRKWLASPTLHLALQQKGYFVAHIDSKIEGDQALFDALYHACGFPSWFGSNWDALNDSLGDFEWQPAAGYILIFEEPVVLSSERQADFLDILKTKKQQWAEGFGIAFKVLMPKSEPRFGYHNGHARHHNGHTRHNGGTYKGDAHKGDAPRR
jgi:hypothetical protein